MSTITSTKGKRGRAAKAKPPTGTTPEPTPEPTTARRQLTPEERAENAKEDYDLARSQSLHRLQISSADWLARLGYDLSALVVDVQRVALDANRTASLLGEVLDATGLAKVLVLLEAAESMALSLRAKGSRGMDLPDLVGEAEDLFWKLKPTMGAFIETQQALERAKS